MEGVRLAQVRPSDAAAAGLGEDGGPEEAVLLARASAGVAQAAGAVAVDAADGAASRPVPLAVLVGIARVADVAEPSEKGERIPVQLLNVIMCIMGPGQIILYASDRL